MKHFLLIAIFILTIGHSFSQEKDVISDITSRLYSFYKNYPNEKVLIQTDKSIYTPGETIWFNAWIIDEGTKSLVKGNLDLVIRLIDSEGNSILSDVYQLKDGKVEGDITLSEDCKNGNYFITGILPSHKKTEQLIFLKIAVVSSYSNAIIFSISKAENLKVGIENKLTINAKSIKGNIAKKMNIKYTIKQGVKDILQNKVRTDDNGNVVVLFKVPENSNGEPYKIIVSDERGKWETSSVLYTEDEKLKLNFYPEGGTLLPATLTKVGFFVTNSFGTPVDIEGKIIDQNDEEIAAVKTILKGYGIFALSAAEDKKYRLKVTSSLGNDQIFELPIADSKGVSLSISKTDNSFIHSNILFADKQSHDIVMMVSSGDKVHWIARMQINGSGNLKIPLENLEQGLALVCCFSNEGAPLAQRLVFINKKQELKLSISSKNAIVKKGDELEITIQLSDLSGNPISGNLALSISDKLFNDSLETTNPIEIECDPFLKNPLPVENNQVLSNQRLIDYLLLANQLRSHSIEEQLELNGTSLDKNFKVSSDKDFENQLSGIVRNLAMRYDNPGFDELSLFVNNQWLLKKIKKNITQNGQGNESYKKYLETSTNLLEVIRNIKSFTLVGNQILFGPQNSINAQGGALIVVDGHSVGEDISALNNISPKDVQEIRILTSLIEIQRYTGFNPVGVIEITTKKGEQTLTSTIKNAQTIYKDKYRVARKFSNDGEINTTLYWNPNLEVDSTGLVTIKVPSSQLSSDFLIKAVGYGINGQFGSSTYTLKVKKE